jgi:hypothetical protein
MSRVNNKQLNYMISRGIKKRVQSYNANDVNGYAYIGALLYDKHYRVLRIWNELL